MLQKPTLHLKATTWTAYGGTSGEDRSTKAWACFVVCHARTTSEGDRSRPRGDPHSQTNFEWKLHCPDIIGWVLNRDAFSFVLCDVWYWWMAIYTNWFFFSFSFMSKMTQKKSFIYFYFYYYINFEESKIFFCSGISELLLS